MLKNIPDDDTQKYITISAPTVLNANADSYEVVLPDIIGAQDQVLSITNDTTDVSSATLGWIDVTSTIAVFECLFIIYVFSS